MSKAVKKNLEAIKAEVEGDRLKTELEGAPIEEMGLDPGTLQKFKPVGDRFQNLVERRPRSQRVTIRFEDAVLSFLKQDAKRLGKPYQTHINDILRTYVAMRPSQD